MSHDTAQKLGAGETWLAKALGGDKEAFGRLVSSQSRPMLRAARRLLRPHRLLRAIYDEDDAAYGALGALWEEIDSGGLPPIEDLDGLMGAYRKALTNWIAAAADYEFAEKRGGPGVRCGRRARSARGRVPHPEVRTVSPDDLEQLESDTPPPERVVMQAETVERLLALLSPRQKQVVLLRVKRLTVEQIHLRLGLSQRTIKRIMRRVRATWRASGLAHWPETMASDSIPGAPVARQGRRLRQSPSSPAWQRGLETRRSWTGSRGSGPASLQERP